MRVSKVIVARTNHNRAYIKCRDGRVTTYARAVLEVKLGRELRDDEHAHHLNGDCTDDRPENLVVLTAGEHHRLHGHGWRTSRWSSRTCKGCGCDHDSRTAGCEVCRLRFVARRLREKRAA